MTISSRNQLSSFESERAIDFFLLRSTFATISCTIFPSPGTPYQPTFPLISNRSRVTSAAPCDRRETPGRTKGFKLRIVHTHYIFGSSPPRALPELGWPMRASIYAAATQILASQTALRHVANDITALIAERKRRKGGTGC